MFKTHFFKKENPVWKTATTPQMSAVLASLPEGELLTIDRIIKETLSNKDNTTLRKDIEVKQVLQDLIKGGFVGEAFSEKIFRFVKNL